MTKQDVLDWLDKLIQDLKITHSNIIRTPYADVNILRILEQLETLRELVDELQ